ncbi:MAG: urea transport system ATP-binding protein [Actinomycetota bacterium]|jgi:urea transport system ATP-binding protein|nr:urea transport system ATP-binding protein [Actinomycetota bacterium]
MRLEVDDVRVAYRRTEVLFGVSIDVPDGSLTCLMGRNGVGKSTLLNAVMGLLPLKAGRVSIDGRDIAKLDAPHRARAGLGYVPQGHQVFPHLTTLENLRVVLERDRRPDPTAIDDALDVFPALRGLLGRPAGLLSGGQAQQLAIARVLVSRPKLLVLDEPTEGIQPSIILEIEDVIAALHRETGMTILLVEQYVEFALRLADRYAVMEGGLITHAGDAADVDLLTFSELLAV